MIKKIYIILIFTTIALNSIFAQTKKDSLKVRVNKDTIPAFFGISFIPSLNWKISNPNAANGGVLKYTFNQHSLSSFEGSFGIQKIGLRFGASANFENNLIGKAYRFAGYIGIKNYWIKIQSSKISGSIDWSGSLPIGYYKTRTFNNNYFNIELLKTSKMYKHLGGGGEVVMNVNRTLGTYWGIGYTSFGFPIKMSTLITPTNSKVPISGVPAYDTLFTTKFYTASIGFDMLRQLSMTGGIVSTTPGKRAKPFGMYASTQDKIGFGSGTISNYGKSMAEVLNPGHTITKNKGFTTLIHYSLSVGFRYYKIIKPVLILCSAGYDIEGASIINFGGMTNTDKDLGYDTNFFYLNHGMSFKLYISWVGNKK